MKPKDNAPEQSGAFSFGVHRRDLSGWMPLAPERATIGPVGGGVAVYLLHIIDKELDTGNL